MQRVVNVRWCCLNGLRHCQFFGRLTIVHTFPVLGDGYFEPINAQHIYVLECVDQLGTIVMMPCLD